MNQRSTGGEHPGAPLASPAQLPEHSLFKNQHRPPISKPTPLTSNCGKWIGGGRANENLDVCDRLLIGAGWNQVIKASHNMGYVGLPISDRSLAKSRQQLPIWPGNNASFSSQYLFLISTCKTGVPTGEEAKSGPAERLQLSQPSEQNGRH